jgi:hypothetical protein
LKILNDNIIKTVGKDKQKRKFYKIECDCGKVFDRAYQKIKNGSTKCYSCSHIKHGWSQDKEKKKLYYVYDSMKQRCNNKNNKNYSYYGGRGISICEQWNNFTNFKEWAISNGYKTGLTIDRINNDGNYEPSNCRWVNMKTQVRNTRVLSSTNSSGYRCVYKHRNKWNVKLTVDYKVINLGMFNTAEDGARAYNKYVIDNKLEHALNEIKGE